MPMTTNTGAWIGYCLVRDIRNGLVGFDRMECVGFSEEEDRAMHEGFHDFLESDLFAEMLADMRVPDRYEFL